MDVKISYSQQEAKAVLWGVIGLDLILVIIYVLVHILGSEIPMGPIRPMFDLDQDLSVPGWYSAIKLFAIAVLLLIAAKNNSSQRYLPSSFLAFGSLLFVFLSADEGSAIHEKITVTAKNLELDWLLIEGHGAWIIVYFVLAFPIVLLSIRYFRRAWKHFRRETITAISGATVVVTGAVIFEIISYFFLRSGSTPVLYAIQVACEEFFEMSGVSLILYSVLSLANAISSTSTPKLQREIIHSPSDGTGKITKDIDTLSQ